MDQSSVDRRSAVSPFCLFSLTSKHSNQERIYRFILNVAEFAGLGHRFCVTELIYVQVAGQLSTDEKVGSHRLDQQNERLLFGPSRVRVIKVGGHFTKTGRPYQDGFEKRRTRPVIVHFQPPPSTFIFFEM